jgi:hypothetical protein
MAAKLNRLILQLQAEKTVSAGGATPAPANSQVVLASVDSAAASATENTAKQQVLHLPTRRRAHG